METIKTTDLKVGDIFAKELKLHVREAFQVEELHEGKNYITVKSRTNNQVSRFNFLGVPRVILLR